MSWCRSGRQRRVLVVEHSDVFTGLLVDEVFGMQRFSQPSLIPQIPQDVEQRMVPFLRGQFIREQAWQVFSPWAVVQSEDFMDLAS